MRRGLSAGVVAALAVRGRGSRPQARVASGCVARPAQQPKSQGMLSRQERQGPAPAQRSNHEAAAAHLHDHGAGLAVDLGIQPRIPALAGGAGPGRRGRRVMATASGAATRNNSKLKSRWGGNDWAGNHAAATGLLPSSQACLLAAGWQAGRPSVQYSMFKRSEQSHAAERMEHSKKKAEMCSLTARGARKTPQIAPHLTRLTIHFSVASSSMLSFSLRLRMEMACSRGEEDQVRRLPPHAMRSCAATATARGRRMQHSPTSAAHAHGSEPSFCASGPAAHCARRTRGRSPSPGARLTAAGAARPPGVCGSSSQTGTAAPPP